MLTDVEIRKARPAAKSRKLYDSGGLCLLIEASGSKLWRFRYRFGGREKSISLGAYPAVTLSDARERRDDARKMLANGVDPSAQRRAERKAVGATFEALAREWLEKFSPSWEESHATTVSARLEQHLFPFIGDRPVAKLTAAELLAALRRVESAGHRETARRVRQIAGQVLRYAVACGKAAHDVSADLRGALAPPTVTHRAAIIKPGEGATPQRLREVGALLRMIDSYEGVLVRCAMQFGALTVVRPGELRHAEWGEMVNIDGDTSRAQWLIPPWKLKVKTQALIVPLSRQAIDVLRTVEPISRHASRYVFPSARSPQRCISDGTTNAAMRALGIGKDEMTGHGWRSLFRTIGDEVLGFRVELLELQLAHLIRDPLKRAYARTAFVKERTELMQAWADYLDDLRAGRLEAVERRA